MLAVDIHLEPSAGKSRKPTNVIVNLAGQARPIDARLLECDLGDVLWTRRVLLGVFPLQAARGAAGCHKTATRGAPERMHRGKQLKVVGEPGFYRDPSLSPDGKSVAITRNDPHTGNQDIWTIDLATGKGTAITNDLPGDSNAVWSGDGKQLVYVSFRDNGRNNGLYRKASDGSGTDELVFKTTPGAGMDLSDWSPDGRFLTFATGALSLVQLRENQPVSERKAIDWLRDEYDAFGGRFSPDMRVMAYEGNPDDKEIFDIFVRTFDASKPEASLGRPVQVSRNGTQGVIYWSKDSKELCYLTTDWEVECAQITATPTLKVGTPKVLFKLPTPSQGDADHWVSSRDGKQFVFVMPTAGK